MHLFAMLRPHCHAVPAQRGILWPKPWPLDPLRPLLRAHVRFSTARRAHASHARSTSTHVMSGHAYEILMGAYMLYTRGGHRGVGGHLFQGISGQGALLSALSRAVLAVPALGKVPSCRYLPRLLTTLTANAARDLLAVVPGGTGTIGAAAEVIEAVMRGALAATGGVEHAFADGCKLF